MAFGQSSNGEALPHISRRVQELDVWLFCKHPPRIYDVRVMEMAADPYRRPCRTGTKGKCFKVALPI